MVARLVGLALFMALCGCSGGSDPDKSFEEGSSTGPVVNFETADREMNEAMAAARRDIAIFRERLVSPTATQQLGLKARFGQGDDAEHMWIGSPRVEGDGFAGTLANQPVQLSTPRLGDPVTITVDQVSDWYVFDEGKVQGGYTLRVIRRQLSAEEQQAFDESMGFVIE